MKETKHTKQCRQYVGTHTLTRAYEWRVEKLTEIRLRKEKLTKAQCASHCLSISITHVHKHLCICEWLVWFYVRFRLDSLLLCMTVSRTWNTFSRKHFAGWLVGLFILACCKRNYLLANRRETKKKQRKTTKEISPQTKTNARRKRKSRSRRRRAKNRSHNTC